MTTILLLILCVVWAVIGILMLVNSGKCNPWVNGARNQGLPKPVMDMVRKGEVKIIERGKDYCIMEKL